MCGAPECLPEATGRPVCTKYHVSTDLSVEKGRRVHSRDHDFRAARLPVVVFHDGRPLGRPLVLVQHARNATLERGVERHLVVRTAMGVRGRVRRRVGVRCRLKLSYRSQPRLSIILRSSLRVRKLTSPL